MDGEDLQIDIDQLQLNHTLLQAELEAKDNELREYIQQLVAAKKQEEHYIHETEVLQTHEEAEKKSINDQIQQLNKETNELHQNFQESITEADIVISNLQTHLQPIPVVVHNDEVKDASGEEALHQEETVEILMSEINMKNKYVEDCQKKMSRLIEERQNLLQEREQLKDRLECKKKDHEESDALINNLQKELISLKNNLHSMKFQPEQSESDGSLFSEVNDKRLCIKDNLSDLKEEYNKLQKLSTNQEEILFDLKQHNYQLEELLNTQSVEFYDDYDNLISCYEDRIHVLNELSNDYCKIKDEWNELLEKGLPKNISKFNDLVLQDRRKTEEKLKELISKNFNVEKIMTSKLKEHNLHIRQVKASVKQLQEAISGLKESIEVSKVQENAVSADVENADDKDGIEIDIKSAMKPNKEDEVEVTEDNSICNDKKVTFSSDTMELEKKCGFSSKKGGKVLKYTTIHIPSFIKKN